MTDFDSRTLERAAAAGGIDVQAALQRAHMRAGLRWAGECRELDADPLRHVPGVQDMHSLQCPLCDGTGHPPYVEGVQLAAYCGDEASRKVLGDMYIPGGVDGPGCWSLTMWVSGFSRWGRGCLARAACAAGRQVLPPKPEIDPVGMWRDGLHAIECCEAWIADPNKEHLQAWQSAVDYIAGWRDDPDGGRIRMVGDVSPSSTWIPRPPASYGVWPPEEQIKASVHFLGPDGEQWVRRAICETLVPWGLTRQVTT